MRSNTILNDFLRVQIKLIRNQNGSTRIFLYEQTAIRLAVILFLLFPFLFLLTQFNIHQLPDWGEVLWAFKNSFFQAALSTVMSLFFGIWAGLGLLCFPRSGQNRLLKQTGALNFLGHFPLRFLRHFSVRSLLQVLCLLPNFLPPIFTLLSALNIVDPFPLGVTGIVLVHTLINYGLVAVMFAALVENKAGGVIELAYVEGASKFLFLRKGLLPLIAKDLWFIALFVFIVCFQSFSVPLIVGGGRGTTVEVLIYEKIRLSSDWGAAVFLSALQSLLMFFLAAISGRKKEIIGSSEVKNLKLIFAPSGFILIIAVSFLYFLGYGQGVSAGLKMISTLYEAQSAIILSFAGSLAMGITVGLFNYGLLMFIAYAWPKQWFDNFLSGYVAPSTSLACFAFLILGPNGGVFSFVKISLAMTLMFVCNLFRMGWRTELAQIKNQIQVAQVIGATHKSIFWEIIFPQVTKKAGVLSGVAAVWACGDFAMSRILAHQNFTIAMMTETLMSGYRLNQATVLSLLIILSGLLCFATCVGVSNVLRRKFAS